MPKRDRDIVELLWERDESVRVHHAMRTGRDQPRPMTLEGMAAQNIERLRTACQKAADIIDSNNGRQAEKVADAASVLKDALAGNQ